jgi:beta-N-acetylhexosaminidase
MKDKQDHIQELISKMTIEQKVGQCLVIGFVGTIITPEILKRIRNYSPAGIRAGLTFRVKTAVHDPYAYNHDFLHRVLRNPKDTVKDYIPRKPVPNCTNTEYCEFLNTMKTEALKNGLGIPLHITMDMEGDISCDYFKGGIFNFPFPMGLTASGETESAYDAAWATASQVTPLGFNWIHSPVLDVNTEPMNPEIGTRSYGESADQIIPYALEALKGFKDGGLITTGKHFPGRGASATDAHSGLPVIDMDADQMQEHLNTFQALIDAGIPSIMTAHTIYPAFDSINPATLSKAILTDLLKGKMGFDGVITTDDITMGGIVERYEVHQACVESIKAGADLILIRDESPLIDEVFAGMVEAVQKGDLPDDRLNDAIRRTLSVKYDYGLFENGNIRDIDKAGDGINEPKVAVIAKETADKALKVVRDNNNILPLSKDKKVLLIEQRNPLHERTNSQKCHPGILWENMLKFSDNVGMVEVELAPTEYDLERITRRIDEAEIIITTNYFDRRKPGEDAFVKELHKHGKPVIVITNSPYPFTVSPEYQTVIVTYGSAPESMAAAARAVYEGK